MAAAKLFAHVAAVGARTPVGFTAESAAAAVRAGVSRLGAHPVLVDGSGDPLHCAYDPGVDVEVTGADRLVALALAALGEVVAKLSPNRPLGAPLALLLAVPDPRPGFGPQTLEAVVNGIAARPPAGVPSVTVEAVPGGHAAGFRAIEKAMARLAQRQDEICVVGGVDSYLEAETLDWLDGEGRLTRKGVRGGFLPGEGAGMLALTTRGALSWLGLRSLAEIRTVATGRERRSIDDVEGLLGEGIADVVRRATEPLSPPAVIVDDVYCDINGERHRTDDWGFMILRAASAFRDATDYVSAAGNWGDMGAATGALGCVLATQAFRRGYATGPRALVCGSSDGGLRGAALLERLQG